MPKNVYSDEFKKDAVALVESGMSQTQVCKDLGVSRASLQSWARQERFKSYGLKTSPDPVEQQELRKALKRIRELEQENEVLRRAAAYLSQIHVKNPK